MQCFFNYLLWVLHQVKLSSADQMTSCWLTFIASDVWFIYFCLCPLLLMRWSFPRLGSSLVHLAFTLSGQIVDILFPSPSKSLIDLFFFRPRNSQLAPPASQCKWINQLFGVHLHKPTTTTETPISVSNVTPKFSVQRLVFRVPVASEFRTVLDTA